MPDGGAGVGGSQLVASAGKGLAAHVGRAGDHDQPREGHSSQSQQEGWANLEVSKETNVENLLHGDEQECGDGEHDL